MQTDDTVDYDIRITERQRQLLANGLIKLLSEGGWTPQVTETDRAEAEELLACLNSPEAPLERGGLNDLTPIF